MEGRWCGNGGINWGVPFQSSRLGADLTLTSDSNGHDTLLCIFNTFTPRTWMVSYLFVGRPFIFVFFIDNICIYVYVCMTGL